MGRYVLYVNVENLPRAKAEEYMKLMKEEIRKTDFLDKEDKLFIFPRRNGVTEFVKID